MYWGGNLCLPSLEDEKFLPKGLDFNFFQNDFSCSPTKASKNWGPRSFTLYNGLSFLEKTPEINLAKNQYIFSVSPDAKGVKVQTYDLSQKRLDVFRGKNIVLACSPIENSTLLLNSGFEEGVGEGLNDHLLISFLVLRKKRKEEEKLALQKLEEGIFYELNGPYPMGSLNAEDLKNLGYRACDREHEYFMFHAWVKTDESHNRFISLGDKKNALGFKRPSIHWSLSKRDKKSILILEKKLLEEIELFLGDDMVEIFQTHDPRDSQGIAHEAGGMIRGRACDERNRLYESNRIIVGDSSALGSALDVYPSGSVLAMISQLTGE